MKKIAFMFAAAAMIVACGKAKEVTLTTEDSLAVKAQVMEALNAEMGEAPVMAELAEDATEEMKAKAEAEFDSLTKDFKAKLEAVTIDSTTEAFKAALADEVKKFEEALNKPAEEPKAEEQK